jgi:DNA primase
MDKKNENTQVEAGQLARAKAINELYQYGWKDISAISLPIGTDPDEYIIKNGKDAFLVLEKNLTQQDIIRVANKYRKYAGK